MKLFCSNAFALLFWSALAAPQQPEINDQFETTQTTEKQTEEPVKAQAENAIVIDNVITKANNETGDKLKKEIILRRYEEIEPEETITVRIYRHITERIQTIFLAPKVNSVLRNVGTCIVNGAMEIISYYLPAPVMPLLASAAGMVIPFEPVVMLREKMPVTSYRRAFKTAVNSFMNTFDKYKVDDDDFDPYMTRRFNRRFMNDIDNGKKKYQ